VPVVFPFEATKVCLFEALSWDGVSLFLRACNHVFLSGCSLFLASCSLILAGYALVVQLLVAAIFLALSCSLLLSLSFFFNLRVFIKE